MKGMVGLGREAKPSRKLDQGFPGKTFEPRRAQEAQEEHYRDEPTKCLQKCSDDW